MDKETRDAEQPGTKVNDPAEGRRADARPEAVPADIAARPGTKTAPPAEGGDDVSGAREPSSGQRQPGAGRSR